MATIKRPALGQVAGLGTLYDAQTDTFVPVSLFTAEALESAITKTDHHTVELYYSESDSFKEKFSKMGFNAELKASFLAGMVSVEGSGSYLTETRETSRIHQASMFYKITTVQERLNFMSDELRNFLVLKTVDASWATHVVAEIIWGAHTIVTAKSQISENDDRNETDVKGSLFARIKNLGSGINGRGEYQPGQGDKGFESNIEINIHGDVLPGDDAIPTTFESAYEFMSKVPAYIRKANTGKGKPLMYTLLPLAFFKLMYCMDMQAENTLVQLGFDTLERFVHLFDEFREARRALSDYHSRVKDHPKCVPASHVSIVSDLKVSANAQEAALRSQYFTALKDARSGKVGPETLSKLLEKFNTANTSPNSLLQATGLYSEKMDFFDFVIRKGAKYVGFSSGNESLDNVPGDTFVFYFNWDAQQKHDAFKENYGILTDLLRNNDIKSEATIIIKDCDGTGDSLAKPYISHERDAVIISEDVAEERRELAGKCLMLYNMGNFERGPHQRPIKMARVRLPCPNANCPADALHEWICYKCRALISFAYDDTLLYCHCGRSLYKEWTFKCKHPEHGENWVSYEPRRLLLFLQELDPFDALNILILGETGVGKSTFINAFVNYLSYEKLEDAMKAKELNCIIPFSFATQVVNKEDPKRGFLEEMISSGSSRNEKDGSRGQSATQRTAVHVVQIGSYTVRLFDTPGIGDTRGALQDTKNMADVLSVLAHYEKLHGILVLLKPNNSRLTLTFRFCIKELLTHLHRDAAQNMVFGFTNTRGSNYKPGDTFEPLKHELAANKDVDLGLFEDTVYCFDSESFRYLAAYHQGVDLGNREDYSLSWETSAKEAQRLLTYCQHLKPHQVKSTINLNETRHMITQLTKPMAEIARTILDTIKVNEDRIKEISEDKLKKEDMEKELFVTMMTLQAHTLERPRTVCTDSQCIDHQDDGTDPNKTNLRVVYKTLCHNPCYLDNVPADQLANVGLMGCSAFQNGVCRNCGHSWQSHMHVLYELRPERQPILSKATQAKVEAAKSEIEKKEIIVNGKISFIKEIQAEHDEIKRAAIRFCVFLKKNSITPYNDATLEYVDFMIKEERGKVYVGGDKAKLDALEMYRAQYQEQVNTLTEQMRTGNTSELLTEQQVYDKIQQLYSLQHYGGQLKQIKTIVGQVHDNTFREQSHYVRVKGSNWLGSTTAYLKSTVASVKSFGPYAKSRLIGSTPSPLTSAIIASSSRKWRRKIQDPYPEEVYRQASDYSLVPTVKSCKNRLE